MAYGIIEYNDEGLPMCEICGKHFNRVISHVRQKHDMNERDYKLLFGFDLNKGICSKESSERSRIKAFENYDTVIAINLKEKGCKSRFKLGCEGRTRDKVSQQTFLALKERLTKPNMKLAMSESGKRLGHSGLGNKKRWNLK